MDEEYKELMRVTNILCRKVFGFCRESDSPHHKHVAVIVTLGINEIIDFMDHSKQ